MQLQGCEEIIYFMINRIKKKKNSNKEKPFDYI